MSSWILGGDCDGILGSNGCNLMEDTVLDAVLDLFDFLESLFLIETVEEEVNITGRCQLFVVILSQASLAARPFIGDRQKGSGYGASSCDDYSECFS